MIKKILLFLVFLAISSFSAEAYSPPTGTGLAVLNNGPTLIAPKLGTPASGVLTTTTGYLWANIVGGTNTSALLIGTGGSLGVSGSGTITATAVPASGLTGTTLASSVTVSSIPCAGLSNAGTACTASTGTSGAAVPLLNAANAWSAGQAVTPVTVNISTATFTPNLAASNNHNVTLVHASCPCTLANPTNIVTGQSGVIAVNQSATGSDLINTYGTDYIFVNGSSPILSTAASARDLLSYYVADSTHIIIAPLISTTFTSSVTATPGTNVTSVTCASAACNNLRGTYTIVGGTATTGTIATLAWTATPTAYVCTATMNGGATSFGIGNSVATTTGMNITAAVSVVSATFTVNYACQP